MGQIRSTDQKSLMDIMAELTYRTRSFASPSPSIQLFVPNLREVASKVYNNVVLVHALI